MKKLKLTLVVSIISCCILNVKAQTDTLFYENFDTLAPAWKMLRSNVPANQPQLFQLDTIVTKNQSFGAATDSVGNRTESYLTSQLIDVSGYVDIHLTFEHICYIELFDAATVQISLDSGATWSRIPPNLYLGTRIYEWTSADYKFIKFSSLNSWPNTMSNFVYQANTTEWRKEEFSLDSLIVLSATQSIMLRLALIDGITGPIGGTGTHRWIVDDFTVTGDRIVSIEETQLFNDLKINLFPNPAKDYFNIQNKNTSEIQIILRDIKGKEVLNTMLNSQKNQQVDLSNFSSGIYFIEIKSNQTRKVFKLIKQ